MSAEIWTIGGGKGGTGKSIVSCGLGVMLAKSKKRTLLIDADWGGANLHTFLQVKRSDLTLSSFVERGIPLEKLIVNTPIDHVKLIPGDIRSVNPETLKHFQKLKLFKHIRNLDFDYILVDLGAGSQLNIVDTFIQADKMIAVITPEITAIENLYYLLRRVIFRKISSILKEHDMRDMAKSTWKDRQKHNITTLKEFIVFLKGISTQTHDIIDKVLSDFSIYLVLNQVRNREQILMGMSVKSIIIKYFGVNAIYGGYLSYNEKLWQYINQISNVANLIPEIIPEIGTVTANLSQNRALDIKAIDK